jgi:PncC family amidohydrolase
MEESHLTEQLETLAGRLLLSTRQTLAVAESCTGGLLGDRLTDVPGSSEYFLGGVIAYHDGLKTSLLDVPWEIIEQHGAVSAECALAMAQGVRCFTGASIGISITGIAGPTGGTDAKPVGTVYIGIAGTNIERVEHYLWQGDRVSNKRYSVEAALRMLIEYLPTLTEIADS